jgi:DNA-binding NarL/FixJ family response regulator
MPNSNYQARFHALINAVAETNSAEKANIHDPAHLITVGTWSLAYQSHLESFTKAKNLSVNSFANAKEMREAVQTLVHLPYVPGVLACNVDGDLDNALALLKFFNNSHPDAVLKLVFFGSTVDVDSALYLQQQSSGYKSLVPSSAEGVATFIDQALQASLKHRAYLLDSLINVAKLSSLTAKEMSVMVQVLNGFANKEIASQMGNSSRTIEIHRASIFEKMDVKNAIELSMMLHSAVRN